MNKKLTFWGKILHLLRNKPVYHIESDKELTVADYKIFDERIIENRSKEKGIIVNDHLFTPTHPDMQELMEVAFECEGRTYYRFKEFQDIVAYRYHMAMLWQKQFLQHIPSEEAVKYIEEIQKELNYDRKKGIDIGKVAGKLEIFKQRFDISVDPETIYRLASCVYYLPEEPLDMYPKDLNDWKIESWKRSGDVGFFFKKPMSELINLTVTSKTDFIAYLTKAEEASKEALSQVQSLSTQ